jgi:hypothetical protein
MSNNKSGFELRTEILGMAMGLLEENRAQTTNQFYAMEVDQRDGMKLPIIEITPEQVISQAEKLYEFVTEVK